MSTRLQVLMKVCNSDG